MHSIFSVPGVLFFQKPKICEQRDKNFFSISDKQIIRSKLGLKLDYIILQEAVYLKNHKLIAQEKKVSFNLLKHRMRQTFRD